MLRLVSICSRPPVLIRPMRTAKNLLYPERGTHFYLVRASCARMTFVMLRDENNFHRRAHNGEIESEKSRASSQTRRATRNTNRSHVGSDAGHLCYDECDSGGRFRALCKNEKFPLAHERASLPRL